MLKILFPTNAHNSQFCVGLIDFFTGIQSQKNDGFITTTLLLARMLPTKKMDHGSHVIGKTRESLNIALD